MQKRKIGLVNLLGILSYTTKLCIFTRLQSAKLKKKWVIVWINIVCCLFVVGGSVRDVLEPVVVRHSQAVWKIDTIDIYKRKGGVSGYLINFPGWAGPGAWPPPMYLKIWTKAPFFLQDINNIHTNW